MQRVSSAWQSISTQGSSTWQQLRYGSRSQSRRTSRESAAGVGAGSGSGSGAAAARQLALERPYASAFHERIGRCESVLDQIARQHRGATWTSRSRSRLSSFFYPYQSKPLFHNSVPQLVPSIEHYPIWNGLVIDYGLYVFFSCCEQFMGTHNARSSRL